MLTIFLPQHNQMQYSPLIMLFVIHNQNIDGLSHPKIQRRRKEKTKKVKKLN